MMLILQMRVLFQFSPFLNVRSIDMFAKKQAVMHCFIKT